MRVEDPIVSRCLVVGSGIAGLQFALLAASEGPVRIVTKKDSQESSTNYAQGGIAAVLSPLDDFDIHIQDTLIAGDGLCHEDVVRSMVQAGPRLIERLLTEGADFQRDGRQEDAPFNLGREGGHSRRRILHSKDLSGHMLESTLLARCQDEPAISIDEDHLGVDLIHGHEIGLGGLRLGEVKAVHHNQVALEIRQGHGKAVGVIEGDNLGGPFNAGWRIGVLGAEALDQGYRPGDAEDHDPEPRPGQDLQWPRGQLFGPGLQGSMRSPAVSWRIQNNTPVTTR